LAEVVASLLADNAASALGYQQGAGDLGLRIELARRLGEREGIQLGPERVVVTQGASGSLTLLAMTLVDPGDTVLVEELTYPGAVRAFRDAGAEIVPVGIDRGGLLVDDLERLVAELERIGSRPKVLYTSCTCQSPTASILGLERRKALVDLAERFDLVLVQDATYADFRYDEQFPPELITLAPHRAVYVGSFSKSLAPGLRLGWSAVPVSLMEAMTAVRSDLGTSPLLQQTIRRLLVEGTYDDGFRRLLDANHQKRDILAAALTEYCGDLAGWDLPAGGIFIWIVIPEIDLKALDVQSSDHGIVLLTSSHFAVGATGSQGVRLAYSKLDEGQIIEGARRLGKALEASTRR
jgi:DNA-binding transcriptional MocR family regulator